MLALGHAVRRVFGTHPAAYLLGRAFAVPLLALFACTLGAAVVEQGLADADAAPHRGPDPFRCPDTAQIASLPVAKGLAQVMDKHLQSR